MTAYYCIGCHLIKPRPFMKYVKDETGICKDCFTGIHLTKDMTFAGKEFIDIVISPFLYKDVAIDVLKDFKFGRQIYYGEFLTELAVLLLNDKSHFDEYNQIIPVPLHQKRLDERTFNQSDVISKKLGELLGKEVDYSTLIRVRDTLHQSSLKGYDRIQNVKDAFSCQDKSLKGKKVILVDDIYTMGETANECAKTLRLAGAEKVAVFTLCKTVIKQKSSLL